jgi:hypothetical protein
MNAFRVWTLIALAGMSALPAAAQKANLEGTWKLNLSKSFMGPDHPTSDYQLTKKIALTGEKISITEISVHASTMNIPLPDSTTTMEIPADGKEHDVQVPAGFPGAPPMAVKMAASWQGCTLEVTQRGSGFAGSGTQRLFLTEDGAQLIILVELHSTYFDSEQRLVFDKQA